MTYYRLKKSYLPDKKFQIQIIEKNKRPKTIHFGARGMEDFTIHKDEERKQRYIERHKSNEQWDNPRTAGFYSRWLLWNKPTLKESVEDVKQRFGLNISY